MQSGSHRIPGGTFFIKDKFWKDYDSILKILNCGIDFNSGQLVLEIQHFILTEIGSSAIDRSASRSSKCCTLTCNPGSHPHLFHYRFHSNPMPPIK